MIHVGHLHGRAVAWDGCRSSGNNWHRGDKHGQRQHRRHQPLREILHHDPDNLDFADSAIKHRRAG
jgi:hypothetical protein